MVVSNAQSLLNTKVAGVLPEVSTKVPAEGLRLFGNTHVPSE